MALLCPPCPHPHPSTAVTPQAPAGQGWKLRAQHPVFSWPRCGTRRCTSLLVTARGWGLRARLSAQEQPRGHEAIRAQELHALIDACRTLSSCKCTGIREAPCCKASIYQAGQKTQPTPCAWRHFIASKRWSCDGKGWRCPVVQSSLDPWP